MASSTEVMLTIGPVVALLGAGGVGAVLVALINKRANPFDQMALVLEVVRGERDAVALNAAKERAELNNKLERLETKLDEVYGVAASYRDYAHALDEWYAAGQPSPPGRPPRPSLKFSASAELTGTRDLPSIRDV